MSPFRNVTWCFTAFFGVVLLVKLLALYLVPYLTFNDGDLVIAGVILVYLAFPGFVMGLLILLRAPRPLVIVLSVVSLIVVGIGSCMELKPIDTYGYPNDVSVLKVKSDGSKLLVRERISGKTGRAVRDTVLVNDRWIFREVMDSDR